MTFARLIVLIVTALYVLVFAGTFLITVDNTRRYLVAQLESHAQDTATSLGVSLAPHAAEGDTLFMQSIVDAVFDRGYYREIRLVGLDGQPILARTLDVEVLGVPDWFIDALPLSTPRASARLMAGWTQAGRIDVVSHPGHAYEELWRNASQTLQWSLGSLVVAIFVTMFVLGAALRSLRAVEGMALAIGDREFLRLERIPRIRELRSVTIAMNRMCEKVEQMLAEQHERAERLRADTYADPLTGVGNQRAFDRDVETMTGRSEEHAYGALVLVGIGGVEALNAARGHAAGDAFLREIATTLAEFAEGFGGSTSRLGGCQFGVVAPDLPRSAAQEFLDRALAALDALGPAGLATQAHAGLAYFGGGQAPATLRARAEEALRAARLGPAPSWRVYDATETAAGRHTFHEARWRELIGDVITRRAVVLVSQPVKATDAETVLHHEVFARIRPRDGEPVSPGVFLPMASRVALAEPLDRLIVETVIEVLERAPAGDYAVNLCRDSVESDSFAQWLVAHVRASKVAPERLSFEVTERLAERSPAGLVEFARTLRGAGIRFGVDHCGARDLRLEYLRALKADYVKVDGAFLRELQQVPEATDYLRSLVDLAHALDASVIAEHVETAQALELARGLGFDGVQGHHLGWPQPLFPAG